MKIRKILEVKVKPGRVLCLKFSDGLVGEFSFERWFNYDGLLSGLDDDEIFKQAKINEYNAVEWPGEIDLDSEILYSIVSGEKIIVDGQVVFDPNLGKDAWL